MARRRYTSTDISIDKKVNKLAMQYGDFAALLYTWMIPHAEDNCEIAGDPEELMGIVCPLRRDKTEEDIIQAIYGMIDLKLVLPFSRDGKPMLLYPPKNFYKFQTYISRDNRDYSTAEQRETPRITENHREISNETCKANSSKGLSTIDAEKRRESPQNTVSPSPSPSLSPSLSIEEDDERTREGEIFQFFNKNISMITPFQSETISHYLKDGIEPEMILAIMQDSLGKDDSWSWIKKVLNNSIDQNIKTFDRYEARKVERQNIKNRDRPEGKGNSSSSGSQTEMIKRVKEKLKGSRLP